MFTPMNIMMNWIFIFLFCVGRLNNTGVQCTTLLIIANTAPMDRT